MLQFILYCIYSTITLYTACTNVQAKNIPVRRKLIIFLYILTICFVFAGSYGQLVTPIGLAGVSFLLTWKLTYKIYNIISFLLGYLILVCLDYAITVMANVIFHLTINDMQQNYLFPFFLCNIFFLFCLTKLLGFLLHKKIKIHNLFISKGLLFCILGNLLICTVIFVFGIIYGERIGYSPNAISFNSILFFVYFLLTNISFFVIYRTARTDATLKQKLEHYENLQSYTQEVENLYLNIRSFKHDYLDILTSLKLYIDKQDTKSLQRYFYDKILPFDQSFINMDHKLGMLSNLKIQELKSLTSSKLLYAMEKGIHLELELIAPIESISMDILDLIRVMGIFLNNAIEAALSSDDKSISLGIAAEENGVIILLRNSTPRLELPISKLYDRNVSTKGQSRGIGLYNAQIILDQYSNVLWKMDYQFPYFDQSLNILSDNTHV